MTKQDIIAIRKSASEQFRQQLSQFGVKKSKLEDLCAGFEDGMTAMLINLRQAGHITVEEE